MLMLHMSIHEKMNTFMLSEQVTMSSFHLFIFLHYKSFGVFAKCLSTGHERSLDR